MNSTVISPGDANESRNNTIEIQEQLTKTLIELLSRLKLNENPPEPEFDEIHDQQIAATAVALVEAYGEEQADGSYRYQAEGYTIEKTESQDELNNIYRIRDRHDQEVFSFRATAPQVRQMIAQVSEQLIQQMAEPVSTHEIPEAVEILVHNLGQELEADLEAIPVNLPRPVAEEPAKSFAPEPQESEQASPAKPKRRKSSKSRQATADTTQPIDRQASPQTDQQVVANVSDTLVNQAGVDYTPPAASVSRKRYQAEAYTIDADGNQYAIQDRSGQEVFRFEKTDQGYVILSDSMTAAQKQDFLNAFHEIKRSGGIAHLAKQPVADQVQALGNLAPSGSRAVVVGHYILDSIEKDEFQGKVYQYKRDEQGLSIRNQQGIEIVRANVSGKITAQLSTDDTNNFQQLYDKHLEVQNQVQRSAPSNSDPSRSTRRSAAVALE